MKNFIVISLILLIFSSCYTHKIAKRQVIKAQLTYPEITSLFCAETFPINEKIIEKTKFIKGNEVIKTDTITVDCDSVVKDIKLSNKVLIRYKNIYRTDTVFKNKVIYQENTAKVEYLKLENIKLNSKLEINKEQLENQIKLKKQYRNSLYFILGLIVVGLFFKFKS